ncbi:hypothetical protein ACJMK2_027019 [Sinanodonta woodiana]|uniref:Uncharacterized protein n=1 Tax=Sinanodonta woodiana TaxID=1069815 RepID=A0ABD3XPX4_SINWO
MDVSKVENPPLENIDCDFGSGSIDISFHSPAVLPWDSTSRNDDNDSFGNVTVQSEAGSYNTLSMYTASEGITTPISRDEIASVDANDCFITPLESPHGLDIPFLNENDSLVNTYVPNKICVSSFKSTMDEDNESLASSIKRIKENTINEQKLKEIELTVNDITFVEAPHHNAHSPDKTNSMNSNISDIVRTSKSFDKISNASRTSQAEKSDRKCKGNFRTPLWTGTRAILIQKVGQPLCKAWYWEWIYILAD